jgi:hypothetical protein
MTVKITDAIKAARVLRNYCEERCECKDCIFCGRNDVCLIADVNTSPCFWRIRDFFEAEFESRK